MITFLKAQGSSIIATLTDFLVTISLVTVFGMWYAEANAVGVISGGLVNFFINRDWVFNGPQRKLRSQLSRYFLVWCGNLLLNTTGVYMITQYTEWNYVTSKIIVAILVGWFYNYTLQKRYVFKKAEYVS